MNTSGAMDSNLLELDVFNSNLFGYPLFYGKSSHATSSQLSLPLNLFLIWSPFVTGGIHAKNGICSKVFLISLKTVYQLVVVKVMYQKNSEIMISLQYYGIGYLTICFCSETVI